MPQELVIPPVALKHPSVEMIRVWLADQQMHTVLNIGFWESRGHDEPEAWGILLADMMHHIADAHESEYGRDREMTLRRIRDAFTMEMRNPTSVRRGDFVKEKKSVEEP